MNFNPTKKKEIRIPISLKVGKDKFDLDVNPYLDIENSIGFIIAKRYSVLSSGRAEAKKLKNKISKEKYESYLKHQEEKVEQISIDVFEKYGISTSEFMDEYFGTKMYINLLKEMVGKSGGREFLDFIESLSESDLTSFYQQLYHY